jgi:hypothetical protein
MYVTNHFIVCMLQDGIAARRPSIGAHLSVNRMCRQSRQIARLDVTRI